MNYIISTYIRMCIFIIPLISTKWVVYTIPNQNFVPKQQRCTRHDSVCKPKKQNNHISIPFVYLFILWSYRSALLFFWVDYWFLYSSSEQSVWWKWQRRLLPPIAFFLSTNRVSHQRIIFKIILRVRVLPSHYTSIATQTQSLSPFLLRMQVRLPSSFHFIHSFPDTHYFKILYFIFLVRKEWF